MPLNEAKLAGYEGAVESEVATRTQQVVANKLFSPSDSRRGSQSSPRSGVRIKPGRSRTKYGLTNCWKSRIKMTIANSPVSVN
jgi:hypothetical protein